MKLFVCGFSQGTQLSEIADLFEFYGDVSQVTLRQGEKRVYALVTMPDFMAEEAIKKLNGTEWHTC